jgi:hypothetical protein
MRLATKKTLGQRRKKLAAVGFLTCFFLPLVAASQQVTVRDLCVSAARTPRFSASISPPGGSNQEENESDAIGQETTLGPDTQEDTRLYGQQFAPSFEIKEIDRCVRPSPIGVRYSPQLTAMISREYEDSLIHAEGLKDDEVIKHVDLNVTVAMTTPSGIFYRDGDSVRGGPYETMAQCSEVKRQTGNVGLCGTSEGPVFVSLNGSIINQNPFPLGNASIECEYEDERLVRKSVTQQLDYTLAPNGGYVPLQDVVVGQLPSRAELKDVTCNVVAAKVWEKADGIQYLNAPLNPTFRSALVPSAGGKQ